MNRPAIAICLAAAVGCDGGATGTKAEKPAKVTGAVPEAKLATITLTDEAEERLGIELAAIEEKPVARTRTIGGEIMARPGSAAVVSAPVAGTLLAEGKTPVPGTRVRAGQPVLQLLPLVAPDRNLQVQSKKDVEVAKTRFDAAKSAARRAKQMLDDGTGDARTLEQAEAELAMAQAELEAAKEQLGRIGKNPMSADVTLPLRAPVDGVVTELLAAPNGIVSQGAPLVEIANLSRVWVRVPVYAGDLGAVDRGAIARVRQLGAAAEGSAVEARPVPAPPSGDPRAASIDLFCELENEAGAFLPGQRVQVVLTLSGSAAPRLVAPWSAVIYDARGGTWVYESTAPRTYVRRRVDVADVAGDLAILARGPAAGAKVVSTGAADLYGTEFEGGK